jgi:polysaccharide export outer membrane protein
MLRSHTSAAVLACILLSTAAIAQQNNPQSQGARPASPVMSVTDGANLPFQPLGPSDLVRLSVYDSPELSRSFRVDQGGSLLLPLLKQPVKVTGLLPDAAAKVIAQNLKDQQILVDPIVDVAVVEYRSRAVTISGAVKSPGMIQEFQDTRILDAINDAGGFSPDAGPEVVLERPGSAPSHVLIKDLLDGSHSELNVKVTGGDRISVPEVQKFFVVGQVKAPGSFPFTDSQDTTVLKAVAMSGGLDSFNRNTAYIYRAQPGEAEKKQIEVPLRRIMDRKSPDVRLAANDILYIPTNRGMKNTASVLSHITGMGNTAVSAAIWSH